MCVDVCGVLRPHFHQVHPAVASVLDNPLDLGNKANWIPKSIREQQDRDQAAAAAYGGAGGGGQWGAGGARDKGSKAERRVRAQMRGEDWKEAEDGEDEEWVELLKGLDGLGSPEGGIDRETDQRLYLEMRRQMEDQVLFPDEVDTPLNMTVQERYRKYSAIGDIEKYVWDYTEDLPIEYKRRFQLMHIRRTFRRAVHEADLLRREVDSGQITSARAGLYVCLHLVNVSRAQADQVMLLLAQGSPVVVSGMLRHENKKGVLHMSLNRHVSAGEELIIKTKDEMQFDLAFRRFRARPVFSQAMGTPKVGQVKFLMQEYFLPGPTTATILAPVVYPGMPALAFRAADMRLIAVGHTDSMDADRVILKRRTLTGYPFRIHKRMVVIRWMFFYAADADALRRAKVVSKFGLDGEILGPLGTHGLVRCTFSEHVSHKDTVCLHLYKRVFPKPLFVE